MFRGDTNLAARLALRVEKLANEKHKLYLSLITALALLGYTYLLFFPVAITFSLVLVLQWIPSAETAEDWVWVALFAVVACILMYVFFRFIKLKYIQTQGLSLSKESAPALYKLISEVRSHYKRPSINNVVITDKFELYIERIPTSGLPVLFRNNLVIGLPLLQVLTPEELFCEISRCVGQYSDIKPRLTLSIYKARRLWQIINESLNKNSEIGLTFIRWFYNSYSALFDIISAPAIRMEEINADSFALDRINDHQMLNTLKSESIGRTFLELHYWPSVRNMVINDPKAKILPFAKLEKVIRSVSTAESRKKWLEFAYGSEQLPGDLMPQLRERMEAIGHVRIREIPVSGVSAAEKYLGKNKSRVVSIVDKLWRSTTLTQWVREYKAQRRDLEEIRKLSRKSRQQFLGPREIIRYASLAKKFKGTSFRSSVRKILKRNIQNLMPSFIVNKMRPQAETGDVFR